MKDHPSLNGSVRTFVMSDDSGGGGADAADITECRTAGCTNPALTNAAKKTAEVASDVADVVDEEAIDTIKYGMLGKLFKAGGAAIGWVFGKGKSEVKWANQMTKRGWSEEQISEALRTPGIPARNAVNPGNPAFRHVNPTTGRSVVVDGRTNEVIHVGGDGFDYTDWDI